MNRPPPHCTLQITPTFGAVTVTSDSHVPLSLEFEPLHAAQIADELDRRAQRLFDDPTDTVTLYINAPHYQRWHIPHPAHLATSLRRAADLATNDDPAPDRAEQ